MCVRKPSGFTLVEVLVVIVIISVLVALLIPAVLSARESARRNQCLNNQHEIAVALRQYETEADRLPGWVNSVGSTSNLTWAAMLSPNMGMNDVWAVLRAGGAASDLPTAIPRFLCPSDSAKKSTGKHRLSYVGNCGWYDPDDSTVGPLQAIFTGAASSAGVPMRTDEIPDGAQNTLMFSENVDATQWFTTTPAGATRTPFVADVGMLWATSYGSTVINWSLDHDPQDFPDKVWTEEEAAKYRVYARPSSYHPGGVVVTYCDGHADFLSETIAPDVLQKLMSPNDAEAKGTALHNPPLMP